ncbi:two component transcriptional regulator, LytTR family [Thermoanaerobacter mathranii subsp. mathranii str. A3]|jgi:DNA-binding LytR/AlgR family response regulator|uniref:Stage 0 sporulation protein A homolog n=1 Tax=Thermoanaerobacter mathranii subsp. mathranii (strain DSM 11426 / CCUG 53645 / CIP 108742 / A3) TaxID=583358 RepID=A0ABM5LNN3_THEM3|nr:LytTR family DNA-binding domain-containing protein [Thermoanaerobacter mathranii]ADH60361.1 two component transcriptional regulator, LytTR family [Thermoanaerobacter mathranii subsp. mathranii str. A3]MDK2814444.1 two-component system, LytTR family, response regulator LytT [Thermoanaerobacter sp.]
MLRIVVAEDDINFRKELTKILLTIEDVSVEYSTGDGKDALEALIKIRPNVAILDIGLPRISGIEVARKIREYMPFLEIIFITSFEEYIKDAVKLYASDYIEKPLDEKRLRETLERIKEKLFEIENVVPFKTEDGVKLVNPKEIYCVRASKKRSIVYTHREKFICDYSLKEIEELLDSNMFFRTNRSFLVNLFKVELLKDNNRTSFEICFKGSNYKAYLSKELYEEFRRRIKAIYRS